MQAKNASHSRKKKQFDVDSIFYQGIFTTQTRILNYTAKELLTTTGEYMVSTGRNNLKPPNILINPHVYKEIKDVNINPYNSVFSYFNPFKLATSSLSAFVNWYNGVHIDSSHSAHPGSINTSAINISEISLGQETDIESHHEMYDEWKKLHPESKNRKLVLCGASRGGATTFNAFAKYKYQEVALVILEACFYSFDDMLSRNPFNYVKPIINSFLHFFTKYRSDGPSPASNIENFPENVPVVFITSKIDSIVPAASTEKLAKELASKKKNDVYLLELEHSRHPNYTFDNREDRDRYEAFIHAIYKKYNMPHKRRLAARGKKLLKECLIEVDSLENKNYVARLTG